MYFLFFLAMLILPLWAQYNVKSTFNKYSTVRNARGLTGADVARKILDSNGLYNIRVEHISGQLTDHYDPRDGVVRLSDSTYGSQSVAAIGVAAHECGHACQHAEEYTPIKIRTAIVPVTNVCSMLWYWVFLVGIIVFQSMPSLVYIGIAMFAAVVLFQLVTLPVELDASNRALKTMETDMILDYDELPHAKKVLKAAAFTYVAALIVSLMQLLRLILSTRRR
ncbi:MAG: zinc metallopeptidase [Ruminococcus sp.]|nr:zinc metallopeptidase [Ruminococcus sp.]HRR75674.1 zinc metallopeptidase [Ruminococcus sp.]